VLLDAKRLVADLLRVSVVLLLKLRSNLLGVFREISEVSRKVEEVSRKVGEVVLRVA
jgi:hypothetical protein